jgi:hypothetical protein
MFSLSLEISLWDLQIQKNENGFLGIQLLKSESARELEKSWHRQPNFNVTHVSRKDWVD